jgi:hypothetical protein
LKRKVHRAVMEKMERGDVGNWEDGPGVRAVCMETGTTGVSADLSKESCPALAPGGPEERALRYLQDACKGADHVL